jgi:tRNA(fMet)-specific endonuclease VapC
MSFLLDTDICSIHTKDDRVLFHRFMHYVGQLHVSVITVGELTTWSNRLTASARRKQTIERLLTDVEILDVTPEVARTFGRVRASVLDRGNTVATADGFIAATALVYDLTLVTHNTKDFAAVPGLRLADWLVH